MESFLTTYRQNYVYPYYVPLLVKPGQPPKTTKEVGVFQSKSPEEHVDCALHSFDPMKKKAEYLLKKEERLICELLKLKDERMALDIAMLDHPCGNEDDTMKSLYEVNYSKKGFPIVPYRKLMPDKDDPAGIPQAALQTGLNDGYRDPTSFRKSAIVRPTIEPPRPLDITAEPILNHYWTFGRSEYQDTISKMGHANMVAVDQFKEPLPSTRRRIGDPCYSLNSSLQKLSDSQMSVKTLGKMNKENIGKEKNKE